MRVAACLRQLENLARRKRIRVSTHSTEYKMENSLGFYLSVSVVATDTSWEIMETDTPVDAVDSLVTSLLSQSNKLD
jgi:hypothetical protein